jgi:hypothetical protein
MAGKLLFRLNVSLPDNASDEFTYDATGNRISKRHTFFDKNNPVLTKNTDIYVRDATGNVLAIIQDKEKYNIVVNSMKGQDWVVPDDWVQVPKWPKVKDILGNSGSFVQSVNEAIMVDRLAINVYGNLLPSAFFKRNASMLRRVFESNVGLFDSCIAVNQATMAKGLARMPWSSLYMAVQDGQPAMEANFTSVFAATYNVMPNLYAACGTSLDLPFSNDWFTDLNAFRAAYIANTDGFIGALQAAEEELGAQISDSIKHKVADSLLKNGSFYQAESSALAKREVRSLLLDALFDHLEADSNAEVDILNHVDSKAARYKAVLLNDISIDDLLNTAAEMDRSAYLDASKSALGSNKMAKLIRAQINNSVDLKNNFE